MKIVGRVVGFTEYEFQGANFCVYYLISGKYDEKAQLFESAQLFRVKCKNSMPVTPSYGLLVTFEKSQFTDENGVLHDYYKNIEVL